MRAQSKAMTIAGWVLTGLLGLFLTVVSGTPKFTNPPFLQELLRDKLGWPPEKALMLGILEVGCTLLFVIPRTSVLGAILLTGYLGGATATHVRIGDPWFFPVILGVLVWLALFLRDPRLRAILPLTPPAKP